VRELAPGTVVDGRYQIVARLGSGGMADVYCAEDSQLGRRVALKVLYPRFAEDDEFVERFRREDSAAAGLQHQHVVSVYDRGEWEGTSYIAMEFVDGRTLKQLIQAEAPMDPVRAIDLTVQVLRAARFAHRRGVIHRDLKPHNVIVEQPDPAHPQMVHAKVADFGIARAGASDMTETGSIMGTAQYLSPEQAQGHATTPQSDLYSVGICLYEMLTGRVPFEGESAVTIALKQVNEAPVPPSHYNAAVPAPLEDAVLRAMAKDPAERFGDADAFIAALEDARAQIVAGSAPPSQPTASFTAVGVGGAVPAVAPVPYEEAAPVAGPVVVDDPARWPWALLAGLLVVAAIVAALLLTGVIGATKVRVPNVVRSDQATAAAVLHRAGLEVNFDTVVNDKPEGIVIGQDPSGGSRVKKGSTVNVTVSQGPGDGQVPVVDGFGRRAARRALDRAGFRVKEQPQSDPTVPKGHVVRSLPEGGQSARLHSLVTIYISTGPPDATVPGVTGQQIDDARNTLENAKFVVKTVDQQTADQDPGTVLAQDPPADATRPEGSTVTLTVARAPDAVDVPDETGKQAADAVQELSQAGFTVVQTTTPVSSPNDDGVVQSQTPKGGSQAKPKSKVKLVVGKFAPPLNPEGSTTPTTPTSPTPPPSG